MNAADILVEVRDRLEEILRVPVAVEVLRGGDGRIAPDAMIEVGPDRFVVEVKTASSASSVAGAIAQLDRHRQPGLHPLLVLPYMPSGAAQLLASHEISWLDLSGNADIHTPHVVVHIEGKRNRFAQRGRPSTPFAPRSSRVVRWLLMHPERPITQTELARATRLSPAQVSRVTSQLLNDGLIERIERNALLAHRPDVLLDAWKAEYDFHRHSIFEAHIEARAGTTATIELGERLTAAGVDHAMTGLAAAWSYTRFAAFRLVTLFVHEQPSTSLLAELRARNVERGANVWFVTPNDPGVFLGASEVDGVRCVHPIQAYLDLSAQPERAEEAAAELRTRLFSEESGFGG